MKEQMKLEKKDLDRVNLKVLLKASQMKIKMFKVMKKKSNLSKD
jgi:hypothetical protein